MRRRKPVDSQAAMAEGVDYLLREFKGLPKKSGSGGVVSDGFDGPIEPTVLVAASNARDEIKAVADFVCDGTDDEEELQAAIEVSRATDYGTVKLSAGVFYLSDQIVLGGVPLAGSGADSTTLRSSADAPTEQAALVYASYYRQSISDLAVAVYHDNYNSAIYMSGPGGTGLATIERVFALMSSTTATAQVAAIILSSDARVHQSEVSSTADGILIYAASCRVVDTTIKYANTYGSGNGYGIKLGAGICWYPVVERCYIYDTSSYSIYGTYPAEGIFTGNRFLTPVYFSSSSTRCLIDGNFISVNDAHALTVAGYDHHIVDNYIKVDPTVASTYDGIVLSGTAADRNSVIDNRLLSDTTGAGGRNAIAVESGADDNIIRGNVANSDWDTGVSDSGTGTVVAFASPLTSKGDLWGYDTADNRLPVGTDTHVLTADSAEALGVKWAAASGASPLTTKGDIHGYDTTDARLPVGTDDQVLTADAAQTLGVKWADAGGLDLATKGDLHTHSTVDAALPVGTDGQVLTADSVEATGMKWATPSTAAGGKATTLMLGGM